jgi:hypothetical protein
MLLDAIAALAAWSKIFKAFWSLTSIKFFQVILKSLVLITDLWSKVGRRIF